MFPVASLVGNRSVFCAYWIIVPNPALALQEVERARETWIAQAELKNWEEMSVLPDQESGSGMFRQMFFGNLGRRRGRGDTDRP